MAEILDFILSNSKEISVAATAIGIAKTGYEFLQNASRAASRDRLLTRIQSLIATRTYLEQTAQTEPNDFSKLAPILQAQLAEALRAFARASTKVEETEVVRGQLSLVQRVFLLYKPNTLRAWIPHLICWGSACFLSLMLLVTWVPTDDSDTGRGWQVFLDNWKQPEIYVTFLFFLGIFLLVRLWGVAERKRYLQASGAIPGNSASFIPSMAAGIYWLAGITLFISSFAAGISAPAALAKLAIAGLALGGSGFAVFFAGRLRLRTAKLTKRAAALLTLPVFATLAISVFNLGGIVLNETANHPLDYWRSWIGQPLLPILLTLFLLPPTYAALKCLRVGFGAPINLTAAQPETAQ